MPRNTAGFRTLLLHSGRRHFGAAGVSVPTKITNYKLSPDFAQVVHIFERLQSEYRIMGLTYCKNSSIMYIG